MTSLCPLMSVFSEQGAGAVALLVRRIPLSFDVIQGKLVRVPARLLACLYSRNSILQLGLDGIKGTGSPIGPGRSKPLHQSGLA